MEIKANEKSEATGQANDQSVISVAPTAPSTPLHMKKMDKGDIQNNIPNTDYTIILFYKYTPVTNPEAFMHWHKELGARLNLSGRVHIATEGINATLEGHTADINTYIEEVRKQQFADLADASIKTSVGTGDAFPGLKVKVKPEIVSLKLKSAALAANSTDTLGRVGETEEDIDPNKITGVHLKPEELKAWYENGEDFIIIDMRNDYEYKVGRFKNSINPGLNNFRDLPSKLPKLIEENPGIKVKKVLTVCTGGVRCEKASGYLKAKGFTDVYQLDGGMHVYMEQFQGDPAKGKPSEFEGSLYTFDNRVTMDFVHMGADAEANAKREIVGKCDVCKNPTERFGHCANDICHLHLLICEDCAKNHVYIWCSEDCKNHGRIGVTHAKDLGTEGVLIAK